jgi:hypothetical protein
MGFLGIDCRFIRPISHARRSPYGLFFAFDKIADMESDAVIVEVDLIVCEVLAVVANAADDLHVSGKVVVGRRDKTGSVIPRHFPPAVVRSGSAVAIPSKGGMLSAQKDVNAATVSGL